MANTYSVVNGRAETGKVTIEKSGLYLRIRLQCSIPAGERFRLILKSSDRNRDLGLCVSGSGELTSCFSLLVKDAGSPPFSFSLERENRGQFIVIAPTQPFPSLASLTDASFAIREGKKGILIRRL